jgi:hypothetical protein
MSPDIPSARGGLNHAEAVAAKHERHIATRQQHTRVHQQSCIDDHIAAASPRRIGVGLDESGIEDQRVRLYPDVTAVAILQAPHRSAHLRVIQ